MWELESSRKADEQAANPRKRKRRDLSGLDQQQPEPQQPVPQHPEPQQPTATENGSLEFCFHVTSNGTLIRIGSFYTLGFSGNSIFVCSSISRETNQFSFKFLLCSFVSNKVDELIQGVACSITDPQQISPCSDVTCSSKIKSFVDKIICEGWERMFNCQRNNIGNISYMLDLRKSCLASQMRQGVWSGISRSATRPAQPIHLGIFDPLLDTKIFGLSSKNQFQLLYKGKDISQLDALLGALWDVKILEPSNPQSHFKFVCQVRVFVHKPSMSLRFNFSYSESNVPFTPTYRNRCIY